MPNHISISIGLNVVANNIGDDGYLLADLVNEIGYYTDGDLGSRILAEFAEALDDDGRKALAQLAKAAGLIPEASDE